MKKPQSGKVFVASKKIKNFQNSKKNISIPSSSKSRRINELT